MYILLNITLVFFLFLSVFFAALKLKENKLTEIQQSIITYLKSCKGVFFSYEKIEKYLRYRGNPFELTPITYTITRFIFLGACFCLGFYGFDSYIFGFLGGILGFFVNDILMFLKDKDEMETIIFEFKDVYDFLLIQIDSGVFIGDALVEAYRLVSNKRLKKALARLSAEITITKDIEKALDDFETNFKSPEISNFVLVCKQSLKTGKSKKAIIDMSKEISRMNLSSMQEAGKKIEESANTVMILLFIGMLITVLYIAFGDFSGNVHGLVK